MLSLMYCVVGLPCALNVAMGNPGVSIAGTFSLRMGMEQTYPLPFSAEGELVASALESLSPLRAVAVTRTGPSLVGGFSWQITFFSLRESPVAALPLLTAISHLTPNSSLVTPTVDVVSTPRVSVSRISAGQGSCRIYELSTISLPVDGVWQVVVTSSEGPLESFYLLVSSEAGSASMGPIYPTTSALVSEEASGPYPPHAQPTGTEAGQSLQSLLRGLPFFSTLADDVAVQRSSIGQDIMWTITFLNTAYASLTMSAVETSPPSLPVKTIELISPNRVDGSTFSLEYAGHRTVDTLPHNATGHAVRDALLSLVPMMTGDVRVSRRGPGRQGGYSWYVAVVEEPDVISRELAVHMDFAVGLDTTIRIVLLRALPTAAHGLVLVSGGVGVGRGVSNLSPASLLSPQPMVELGSMDLAALLATLPRLELLPPPFFSGGLHVDISVGVVGRADDQVIVNALVEYAPVNQAPEIVVKRGAAAFEDIVASLSQLLRVTDGDAGAGVMVALVVALRGNLCTADDPIWSASKLIQGSLQYVNAELSSLLYLSCLNCNGNDLISLNISDSGFAGVDLPVSSYSLSANVQVPLHITAVNDAPLVSVVNTSTYARLYENASSWYTGLFNLTMNEPLQMASLLSLTDVDFVVSNLFYGDMAGGGDVTRLQTLAFAGLQMQLTINAEYGSLSTTRLSSVMLLVGDWFGTSSFVFAGSLIDLQSLLLSLEYRPPLDWFGTDLLSVSLDDLGNIGVGGAKVCHRQVLLRVGSTPLAPELLVPEHLILELPEDSTGLIGRGDDDPSKRLQMSERSFQIRDRNVPLINNTRRMIVAVDTAAEALYGPVISDATYAPPAIYNVEAFTYAVSAPLPSSARFIVQLRVSHGTLSLSAVSPLIEFILGAGFHDDKIEFQGPLLEVNKALEAIQYTPDLNWNSQGVGARLGVTESLEVTVTDDFGLSATASLPIRVTAVNDGPVLSVGPLSLQDSLLASRDQLSRVRTAVKSLICRTNIACPLNDLTVRDVDLNESSNGTLRFSLSSSNGSFYIDPSENTAVAVFKRFLGATSRILTVDIPSSSLDTSIRGIYYRSDADFTGTDSIFVSVSDLGGTGCMQSYPSCWLSDSLTIQVNVADVDLAPYFSLAVGPLVATEQAALLIRGVSMHSHRLARVSAPARGLVASTPDFAPLSLFARTIEANTLYRLRLVAERGTLTLSRRGARVRIIVGSGVGDAVLELEGVQEVLNTALSEIEYVPAAVDPVLGEIVDPIQLSAVDLDSGLAAEAVVLQIIVLPRQRHPQVHVMDEEFSRANHSIPDIPQLMRVIELRLTEDQDLPLTPLFISIAGASSELLQLTLTCTNGTFISFDPLTEHVLFLQNRRRPSILGDVGYLNQLLASLLYRPDSNFSGMDELSVTVCTSTWIEEAYCETRDVPLNVTPVNDPPTWSAYSGSLTVPQDSAIAVGGLLSLTDPDSLQVLVQLEVDVGVLSLSVSTPDLMLLNGSGERDPKMSFICQLTSLPSLLQGLTFLPPIGWNSMDGRKVITLTAQADDLEQPSLSAVASLSIIVAKSRPMDPVLRVPGAIYRQAPCNSIVDRNYPQDALCDAVLSVVPLAVTQNTPTLIQGISLVFPDGLDHPDAFEFFVASRAGVVTLDGRPLGLRVTESNAGLSVVGTVSLLNRLLLSLTYTSSRIYRFTDAIELGVRSLAAVSGMFSSWTNASLPLSLSRENFAPIVAVTEQVMEVLEDHAIRLSGVSLNFSDAQRSPFDEDYMQLQNAAIRLTCSARHGYLLLSLRGLNVTVASEGNRSDVETAFATSFLTFRDSPLSRYAWSTAFIVEGSVGQVSSALQALLYRPQLNWNSELTGTATEYDSVVFDVMFTPSLDQPLTSTSSSSYINVRVHPYNDAPAIFSEDSFFSNQLTEDMLSYMVTGVKPVLAPMNGLGFITNTSVSDVDFVQDGIVLVNLKCTDGVVSVNNILARSLLSFSRPFVPLGLSFSIGTGSNDSVLEFKAPLSIVNEALATITFYPTTNFYGLGARLVLTVSDLGAAGIGGPRSDSRAWDVYVSQLNLAPVVIVPSISGGQSLFTVDEGSSVLITGARNTLELNPSSNLIGFELFAYYEPTVYSADGWGAGRLDVSSVQYFDLYAGSGSSHPSDFIEFQGFVYFQAADLAHGIELWRVDEYSFISKQSRRFKPELFVDLVPGAASSNPAALTTFNGHLFFSASGVDSSWMIPFTHRDSCGSFRQSQFDGRVHFAVSTNNTWYPYRFH
jgi:hypothetical protein